jgi:hypothetical protein
MTTFRLLPLAVLLLLSYLLRGYAGQVAGSRNTPKHPLEQWLFRVRSASLPKIALDGLKMQSLVFQANGPVIAVDGDRAWNDLGCTRGRPRLIARRQSLW